MIGTFLLGCAGIACAAIFVRLALPAPPVVTAFYRLGMATALLLAVLALRRGRPRWTPAEAAPAVLAGVCFGLDMALWNTSLVRTSVANATLLVNTTPLFVGAWAWLAAGERPGARFAAGAAAALAGAAVLLGADLGAPESLGGDVLALAAAVFYSGYLLLVKRARRALDAVAAVALAGVGATLTVGALAVARGDPFTGFPAHSWAAFVALALVSHLGGVLGIVWALRYLRASFASVALLAQPLGAAALGWVVLGEALSALQCLGGLAVIAGILLASGAAADPPGETAASAATRSAAS